MNQVIIRQVTIPKEWNRARLRQKFPGQMVVGDDYGYWFHVEQTGIVFLSMSWKELVKAVSAHLRGNGLPVPEDLNYQMMVRWCAETGSQDCGELDMEESERQRFVTMFSRFKQAVIDAAHNGLVEPEEAERRATICAGCPMNKEEKFRWCLSCAAETVTAAMAKLSLGRSTSRDAELKTCRVCWCKLPLKVWIRKEGMNYPDLEKDWPEHCWMKE